MPHRKLDRHLGTRGWILLVCAWVWGLLGLGVVLQAARTGEPSLLHLYMPVPLRVTLWWAPALLAVYGAFWRKRLPVVTAALIIAPLIRVVSYVWAWFTWVAHESTFLQWMTPDWFGVPSGWYSAAIHLPLIALVLIAAHSKEGTRDEVQ